MGILDRITEAAKTALAEHGGPEGAINAISRMISGKGLGNIIDLFRSSGLDEMVSSWIGSGKNIPASKEDIVRALGNDRIRDFAEKAGIDLDSAPDILGKALPSIVDKLTPNGKIENNEDN
jgi:uncharacterized protein YidB (DUF937 family)